MPTLAGPSGLPLRHITVVALEQAVAVPFATRQLADLGARVIKVERPGTGDFARGYDRSVHGQSSYFVWLNRGKESLALDLRDPAGRRTLHQLLEGADVFVQNLGPGAAARMALDARTLAARHPRLIACDLSGYGSTGPQAQRKAYDLLIQYETGLVSLTGDEEHPAKAGISIADIAGGMYVLTGILTALYDRERSAAGRSFEVSLLDSLGEWLGAPAAFTVGSGRQPARTGLAHATISPYGPYPTADGTLVIAVQNEREWGRLCDDVFGGAVPRTDPRFKDNPARVANRTALDAIISEITRGYATVRLAELLDTAGIANTRWRDVAGFLNHPQLDARGRWCDVATPGGSVRALRPPVVFHDGTIQRMGPVPALGEHTGAILAELAARGPAAGVAPDEPDRGTP